MTVLFFTRLFYPHIGGVETHVQNLSLELIKKGHSITVVCEQHDKSLSLKQTYKNIVIYRIPVSSEKKKKLEIWKWLFIHRNLIKSSRIIHAHDVAFWYFPFRILYPFQKFYVTFHGYETTFPPKKSAIVIRKISEFISNGSISIGAYIKKWYGAQSEIVMYGGINEIQNSKFKIQNFKSKVKILFIGRIEEDNGVSIYAQVLQKLNDKKIPFEFEAVGDGSKRKLFEKFGKVHGFVKNVENYTVDSDIVFASSYLSMLQGMSFKKQIVSVYNNELKKDYLCMAPFAKWIIIENDPEKIAKEFVSRTYNQKKAESAYNWVRKQTWREVSTQYELLWKQ